MTVWFTSDTHFGHANIIGYSERPFASCDAMDEALAANWNAVVRPGDTVWHLGDFAFKHARPAAAYLERLNGEKHLVWGNHDDEATRGLHGWASSGPYAEVTIEGTRLVLFHYAMRVWNRSHRGAVQLYGHSHIRWRATAGAATWASTIRSGGIGRRRWRRSCGSWRPRRSGCRWTTIGTMGEGAGGPMDESGRRS